MESKLKPGLDLRDELPFLTELGQLREEATTLRDGAMQALVSDENWEPPHGDVTTLIRLRALKKWERLGLSEGKRPNLELPCLDLRPRGRKSGKGRISLVDDDFAVFAAATFLRARLDDLESGQPKDDKQKRLGKNGRKERLGKNKPGGITKDVILALYAIMKELYVADAPDWALGGARAGSGVSPNSLFVTMECSRAIGYFAVTLKRTAAFLVQVAKHTSYIERIERTRGAGSLPEGGLPLPGNWCGRELLRVKDSLISLIIENEERILLKLPDECQNISLDKLLEVIEKRAGRFLRSTETALKEAIADIEKHWRAEEKRHAKAKPGPMGSVPGSAEERRKLAESEAEQRAFELSITAHKQMASTIRRAIAQLGGLDGSQLNVARPEKLKIAAMRFQQAADQVRGFLGPVYRYTSAAMHELLLRSEEQSGIYSAQELSFAASCAGAIADDWHDPIYKRIAALLEKVIDPKGQLPIGPAFYLGANDAERFPINAHTVRAMAHIFSRSGYRPSVETVRRMVRAFSTTALVGSGGKEVRWKRMPGGTTLPSPWVTAVHAISLGRVVRMLDERINDQVLVHFTVKDFSRGGAVPMDDIMCSDIGLASKPWTVDRPMLTQDMERLRRRLVPKRIKDPNPFRSMIIYGPPGTGKTTIVNSLALGANVPLVEITPSDLLIGGAERLEYRAKLVMSALKLLTRVVILFDEFDPVIFDRKEQRTVDSVFSFLTGGMLPKLADLNSAAKKNGFVYILATNYVEKLDAAAIRNGRFDHKRGVYAPDLASRICRMVSQLNIWNDTRADRNSGFQPGWQQRVMEVLVSTASVSIERLVQSGWFLRPDEVDPIKFRVGSAWYYMLNGGQKPEFPMPLGGQWGPTQDTEKELSIDEMALAQEFESGIVGSLDKRALEYLRKANKSRNTMKRWLKLVEIANDPVHTERGEYKQKQDNLRQARIDRAARRFTHSMN